MSSSASLEVVVGATRRGAVARGAGVVGGITVTGTQASGATGAGTIGVVCTVLPPVVVVGTGADVAGAGVCTATAVAAAAVDETIGTAAGVPDGTGNPTLPIASDTPPTITATASHWRPPIGEGAETADGRGRRWRPREDRWLTTPT